MNTANEKLKKIPIHLKTNPEYLIPRHQFIQAIENFFYHHKNKLVYVHISMFILFLSFTVIPVFLPTPLESDTVFDNFTLFSQFLLWGIWFPFVFASVIFTGRSWCGILCPMGAASEWANKIGFKRNIPGWLKWEGTPILSFLLITILGQTIDVRDQADAILEIFGGTLMLALLIGFFYGKNKRAWCRHVCPIGLLLGVFSRMGIVQFAPKHPREKGNPYTEKGVCPTMIAISRKDESRHCIQCFRCVKPSSPGGLFVRLRKIGHEIIHIRDYNPNLAEIWFIFLGTGVALGGFLWLILPEYQILRQAIGTWFIEHEWYWIGESGSRFLMSVHPEARQTYNWLDFMMITGFMAFCMLLVTAVLSACTLLSSFIVRQFTQDKNIKIYFTELGYQFTPVAMLSIIIGLGDKLFTELHHCGVAESLLASIKATLLAGSILWSIHLGRSMLQRQNIHGIRQGIALLPGIAGSLFIGFAWWPAIFGMHFLF